VFETKQKRISSAFSALSFFLALKPTSYFSFNRLGTTKNIQSNTEKTKIKTFLCAIWDDVSFVAFSYCSLNAARIFAILQENTSQKVQSFFFQQKPFFSLL